jgi:hypothetical protein
VTTQWRSCRFVKWCAGEGMSRAVWLLRTTRKDCRTATRSDGPDVAAWTNPVDVQSAGCTWSPDPTFESPIREACLKD